MQNLWPIHHRLAAWRGLFCLVIYDKGSESIFNLKELARAAAHFINCARDSKAMSQSFLTAPRILIDKRAARNNEILRRKIMERSTALFYIFFFLE
jgi:hypothetical protein